METENGKCVNIVKEIVASVVTTNDIKDIQVLGDLLEQIDDSISQVSVDGAYDSVIAYTEVQLSSHNNRPLIFKNFIVFLMPRPYSIDFQKK